MSIDPQKFAKDIEQKVMSGELPVEPTRWVGPTPPGWRVLHRSSDGVMWRVPGGQLKVIASAQLIDGEEWAHISVSKKSGLPTWTEMTMVRDAVLGTEIEAYQIWPPASRYVNLSPVLHCWACLSKPQGVLPRFEVEVDGIKTI